MNKGTSCRRSKPGQTLAKPLTLPIAQLKRRICDERESGPRRGRAISFQGRPAPLQRADPLRRGGPLAYITLGIFVKQALALWIEGAAFLLPTVWLLPAFISRIRRLF